MLIYFVESLQKKKKVWKVAFQINIFLRKNENFYNYSLKVERILLL